MDLTLALGAHPSLFPSVACRNSVASRRKCDVACRVATWGACYSPHMRRLRGLRGVHEVRPCGLRRESKDAIFFDDEALLDQPWDRRLAIGTAGGVGEPGKTKEIISRQFLGLASFIPCGGAFVSSSWVILPDCIRRRSSSISASACSGVISQIFSHSGFLSCCHPFFFVVHF